MWFILPYHPSAAWFLHILQTSSRQIRARLTRLGLIGHARFCPQILSGRKGDSQDFLYLNVGILGAQWPSWKYCVAMIPRLPNVQKPQTFPWHLYRSAAQPAIQSSTSKRCQSAMLVSAVRLEQSKCIISQSTTFVGHTDHPCNAPPAPPHYFFSPQTFAHISAHSSPERSSGLTKRSQGKGSDMNRDHHFCSNEEEISELGT